VAPFLFVVLMLIVLLPLIIRIGRFLLAAHAWLVAFFLPAGLLVRYGPSQDMRLFIGVTCAWSVALIAYRVRSAARRKTASSPQ
jgi:hypothetical protein